MNNQPLFITGYPRSGTTLLWNMFSQHSNYRATTEEALNGIHDLTFRRGRGIETCIFSHLVEMSKINPKAVFRNGKYPHWFEFYGSNDRHVRSFLRETSLVIRYRNATRWLYRLHLPQRQLRRILGPLYQNLIWIISGNRFIARRFLHHAQKSLGSNDLVEKTPRHCLYIANIKSTCPKAHVIFMIRHPVDVFASHRKLIQSSEHSIRSDLDSEHFCKVYKQFFESYKLHKTQYPDDVLLVRYEDLCEQPKSTFQDICTSLGKEYEPACLLDEAQNKPSFTHSPRVNRDKWRDTVTSEEARWLQRKLGAVMEEVGLAQY